MPDISPFAQILALPVGGETTVRPDIGETPEHALKRLKLRVSKYRTRGLSYRCKIDRDVIRIQRTQPGQNTKHADWLMMNSGDRLLLKTSPTARDIKRAEEIAVYLEGVRFERQCERLPDSLMAKTKLRPAWVTYRDIDGRLLAKCWIDQSLKITEPYRGPVGPLRYLWAGEWP